MTASRFTLLFSSLARRLPRWCSSRNSAWIVSLGVHVVVGGALIASLWGITHSDSRPPPRVAPVVSFVAPGLASDDVVIPAAAVSDDRANERGKSVPVARSAESLPTPAQPEKRDRVVDEPVRLRSLSETLSNVSLSLGGLSRDGTARAVGNEAEAASTGTPSDEPVLVRAESKDAVRFAGLGSSGAKRIVYVIDGSGPMVTSLPDVIAEVERSVGNLTQSQHFGVVVFRDQTGGASSTGSSSTRAAAADSDTKAESFMPVLVRASAVSRKHLAEWLAALQPGGRSNPLDGLRAALAMKPDAVFLLSRSIERTGGGVWQSSRDEILGELDRLNPVDPRNGARAITIKTIQFLDDDPTGIMQAIGEAHGTPRVSKHTSATASAGGGYVVIRSNREIASP